MCGEGGTGDPMSRTGLAVGARGGVWHGARLNWLHTNPNGSVVMAAARGQPSLLSAWGDFCMGTRGENCQSTHEDESI